MFKILGVDHIGVAVQDLEEGKKLWSDIIGIPCTNQETVAEQKVTTTFHPTPNGSEIELLIGTAPDSPITKYIEKKGEGIQHVALRVENAIADLMAKGVRMIDEKPRIGAGGAKIAFLHPKSTKGVLLEICEHPDR